MVRVMGADTTRGGGPSTFDRLADAAISLIARDGLTALSVRRVAAEASLSGGTVQHHFPTKDELYREALAATVNDIGNIVARGSVGTEPVTEQVERATRDQVFRAALGRARRVVRPERTARRRRVGSFDPQADQGLPAVRAGHLEEHRVAQ